MLSGVKLNVLREVTGMKLYSIPISCPSYF